MSTNFYFKTPKNVMHIGRRNMGGSFTFNGTKNETVMSWYNFLNLNQGEGYCIYDEYFRKMTFEEFWSEVVEFAGRVNHKYGWFERYSNPTDEREYIDMGFMFNRYEWG